MRKSFWQGMVVLVYCCVLAASGLSVRAAQPQQAPNLLANGDFEAGGAPWEFCSGAQVVDTVAHTGQQSLRLGPPTGFGCEERNVELGAYQVAYQEVTIPADAEAVTVSFWYNRVGDPNAYVNELAVAFVTEPDALAKTARLDPIYAYDLAGWTLYRQALRPELLDAVRGKTLLFAFQLEGIAKNAEDIQFFIDDVQVQIDRVQTAAAPLPADLQGRADQPIVVTQFDEENSTEGNSTFAVFRTNPDGTQRQRIYNGLLGQPLFPTWSPDGAQIAVVDNNVSNPTDADSSGVIAILSVMNADGSNVREVFRTAGGGGDPDPIIGPEIPNLDTRITSVAWSPDAGLLGVTICGRSRGSFGSSDETCSLVLLNAATSEGVRRVDTVFSFDWGADNRILFSTGPTFGTGVVPGIYELNLNVEGAEPTLLLQHWSNETPFHEERNPVWAPDGQRFAVIRDLAGLHFNAENNFLANTAVVIYDRQNLAAPQFTLLIDHGDIAGTEPLTWSPDGKYLLYTLFNSAAGTASVWWLEVATGATGPALVHGASLGADWASAGAGGAPGNERVFLPVLQQ